MHAIWLSVILPTVAAIPWIWQRVCRPQLWLGLFGCASLGTLLWIGQDLLDALRPDSTLQDAGLRALYLVVRDFDIPAVELVLGFGAAALVAMQVRLPAKHQAETDSCKQSKIDG